MRPTGTSYLPWKANPRTKPGQKAATWNLRVLRSGAALDPAELAGTGVQNPQLAARHHLVDELLQLSAARCAWVGRAAATVVVAAALRLNDALDDRAGNGGGRSCGSRIISAAAV